MADYYSDFPKPQVDERVQTLVSMIPPHLRMEIPMKVIEAEALHVTQELGKKDEFYHLSRRLEDWVRLNHQKSDERF